MLDAAEELLDQDGAGGSEERQAIARGLIDTFRAPVHFFGGETARALACGERASETLRGRFAYGSGWGGFFVGVSQYLLGRPQQSLRTLETLLTDGQDSNGTFHAFFGLLGLTVTHVLAARLPESERTASQMLALERAAGRRFGMAWSHYFLGVLSYETNRLAEAAEHFDHVIALHMETSVYTLYDSFLGAALSRQALGRSNEAINLLDEAEELILGSHSIAFLAELHSMRARLALIQGDLGSAQMWTQVTPMRMAPGPLLFLEVPPLTAARVLLADRGKQAARDALTLISEVEERCRSEHNRRQLVSVLAHQALALANLGRQRAALDKLTASLDLARRSGFVRSFIDLGPPMAALLQTLAAQSASPGYIDRLLSAFAGAGISGGIASESTRIEPLTPRELQILPLLQRRYSNEEIARELGISVLTVKRHTGSLYAKLEASGRRDAVRRAASLGLLSQTD
jgi:LuxR family maltose regulon positive regulatory protein